jgi:hypothetical protein
MTAQNTGQMAEKCRAALNRLCKWRVLLAGWQLGTRPKGDPECDAVRDQREKLLLLRAEVTTLTRLLAEAGIFTLDRYDTVLAEEADALNAIFSERFPGIHATDTGLVMEPVKAAETMRGWKP